MKSITLSKDELLLFLDNTLDILSSNGYVDDKSVDMLIDVVTPYTTREQREMLYHSIEIFDFEQAVTLLQTIKEALHV